jgi:beta-lactamase superfamily II metal-dependent hydrolase
MRLAMLDVGHGYCAVAYNGKEAIVIDCPPTPVVLRFLRRAGIARVRHLIISHSDRDHSGGLATLLKSGIAVDHVWVLDDHANTTENWRNFREAFVRAYESGVPVVRGIPTVQRKGIRFDFLDFRWLAPNHWDRLGPGDRNGLSVVTSVIHRDAGSGLAVFTGDITLAGLRLALVSHKDTDPYWSTSWLAAPHHGGLGGSEPDTVELMNTLLRLTKPDYVHFSFSRRKYGLPRPKLISSILGSAQAPKIRCSQLSRNCARTPPLDRLASGKISHGARHSPIECCTGTIVVDINNGDATWPGDRDFESFVASLDHPMCRP